jgi:hypothetical protein
MSDLIAYPGRASGGRRADIGTRMRLQTSWTRSSQEAESPKLYATYDLPEMTGPKEGASP